ncbi:hypothetical protein IFT67_04575 [Sphingomonas sp. CFBP 13728]|uniref:hypothetical protein n=1 Tax=Sphingomonas sp. CFBP 13728 TaxID=2775294 RepID=UPI001780FC1D|nr:hypothetical protein [Sphingomonas sp. CFBP 13728]MBD8618189.1 hypothetical protein [Sphingomonas sp. CFBP 13728]
MVAHIRQNLIRALPLYGAVTGGVLMAVIVAVLPAETLESLVWTTGVAALVPAASPPLGMTARVLLALGSGLLVGALLWSSLFLLFGPGGMLAKRTPREDGMPVIRRADAHPDAPPRKPMSAADLGTPMMEVGVGAARDERGIPVDLDLPLAAFDPKAIRPVPMEPVRPVSPLAQPQPTMVAPVIEASPTAEPATFVTAPAPQPVQPPSVEVPAVETPEVMPEVSAPTPIARPPRAPAEPTTPPTIETLLQRLEQGALRRGRIGSH